MTTLTLYLQHAQDPVWLLAATMLVWVGWPAVDVACDAATALMRLARAHQRDRDELALNAVYERHGVTWRVGSLPSHRAEGAQP